jgi:hypothetical protein
MRCRVWFGLVVGFWFATTADAQRSQVHVICSVQADGCNMIQTVYSKTTGVKINMSLKGSGEALAQLIAERANPKTDVWRQVAGVVDEGPGQRCADRPGDEQEQEGAVGKTTILRMIAGLETPSSGNVFIGSRDVTTVRPAERNVSMVFQSYTLFPHMDVIANVAYGLEASGVPKRQARERARAAMASVGLTTLDARLPRELSGGQQQRVALGPGAGGAALRRTLVESRCPTPPLDARGNPRAPAAPAA